MKARNLVLTLLLFLALFLLVKIVWGQTATQWFVVTSGDITCRGYKIAGPTPKINLQCTSPRGGYLAGYTAKANALGAEYLQFGDGTGVTGVSCLVGLNATPNPITSGSLGTIPANGAVEQCNNSSPLVTELWP